MQAWHDPGLSIARVSARCSASRDDTIPTPSAAPPDGRPACWHTWRAELIPASPHPIPSSDRPLRPVKGPVAAIESLRP